MSKKKYWIGKISRWSYTLIECDTKPKRFIPGGCGTSDWKYPAEEITTFCAEDFEHDTGLKLRVGESVRVYWRFGKKTKTIKF